MLLHSLSAANSLLIHRTIIKPSSTGTIVISDTQLKNVEHFKYLGSTISFDGSMDKEIDATISKARQALGRLRNKVLS